MKMSTIGLALAMGVAVQAWAGSAPAAPRLAAVTGTTGAGTGMSPGQFARLWGELGFHHQSAFTAFAAEFGLGLMLAPDFELEGVLPYGLLSPDGEGDTGSTFGNPYIGINGFAGGRVRWSGGVTLPLASPDSGEDGLALVTGAGLHGLQDLYLWLPDTLSLVGRVRVEGGQALVLALDMAGFFLIPTGNEDQRDVDFVLQPALELGVRVSPSTRLGVRISAVWNTTADGDNAQAALTPFLRHDFGAAFFTAQLVMNLDEPLGFAFDEGRLWGLFLGLGGAF